MKLRSALFFASIAVAAVFLAPRASLAEPIGPHPPGNVLSGCQKTGGQYWPPTKSNSGEYGCINQSGSGIVCGGAGAYSKTCSYFNMKPQGKGWHPTQEQVHHGSGIAGPK